MVEVYKPCAIDDLTMAHGDDYPFGQELIDSLRRADDSLLCQRSAACTLRICGGNLTAENCQDKGYEITVMTNLAQLDPLA